MNFDFGFPSRGPRSLNLTPELSRRGPPSDDFGMIATAKRTFPMGKWRFTLRSDDGARLFINGQLLIDDWRFKTANVVSADFVQPTTGAIDLRVEFCQRDGGAVLQLFVEPITD